MPRWMRHSASLSLPSALLPSRRCYSHAAVPRRIPVRYGLASSVNVDLHNIDDTPSASPLLIYLPPFSTSSASDPLPLPAFCRDLPTAVINYRWSGFSPWESFPESPSAGFPSEHLQWPTPSHDITTAYVWLIKHLAPPTYKRRNVYVCGSYLSASLATSLAMTGNYPHHRIAVRGCVAFNGVYDWTMFLPNHDIYRPRIRKKGNVLTQFIPSEDPELRELGNHAEALFTKPEKLFDQFASPCLYFHTPGLLAPPSFTETNNKSISRAVYAATLPRPSPPFSGRLQDAESDAEDLAAHEEFITRLAITRPLDIPTNDPLIFPSYSSTLKIPEALLLHTTPSPAPPVLRRVGSHGKHIQEANSFALQASELTSLMRRSITKYEMGERYRWYGDDEANEEAMRRVQVQDVGGNKDSFEIPERGQQAIRAWLEDRVGPNARSALLPSRM
ncbi:hypothetical protein MN608_07324 [Microdochium nivale]|nr:hypothetical protein MN608_07324 [Microdochium nivale]